MYYHVVRGVLLAVLGSLIGSAMGAPAAWHMWILWCEQCDHWPAGTRLLDLGGADTANALLLRGDGQLITAGCSNRRLVAAQVSIASGTANPLVFQADFLGDRDCAYSVQWSDANKDKLVLGGWGGQNTALIALARFQTTQDATVDPTYQLYLPVVVGRQLADPTFRERR